MTTSLKTIKQLIWVLLGVFILTYLISLNMENHYVVANVKWLSNNFLFAIAGGAFASLVVVLVCEIIKYRQLKFATEGALFSYMGNLYGQFLIISGNCKRTLNGHDLVPDNLIQSPCDNAMMLADYINGIDYITFCGKNNVSDVLSKFKTEKFLLLKNVISSFIYLRIAIREDSMMLLQQGKRDIVTSDCPHVKDALNKVIGQTSTILTYLDQIISQMDDGLDNRYNWHNLRKTLNTYQDNFETKTLADYMNEDFVVFQS
ncbi:MAG: hypothetical protein IKO73_00860 [Bacteroidaceae bacterium]|nr:hypothetical protein [Bacteroidaceae bacterium]